MVLLKLDTELNIVEQYKLNTNAKIEKNWQPIEAMPYTYVYSYRPFTLLNISTDKIIYSKRNDQTTVYRGSTPICKYGDYNIGLIHIRKNGKYVHHFVLFDSKLNILKITNEFTFFGVNIEFCTGMRVNTDMSIDLLVSVNDIITYHVMLNRNIIDDLLNDRLHDNVSEATDYDELVRDAINIHNNMAVMCLSTYSRNKELVIDAMLNVDDAHINVNLKKYFIIELRVYNYIHERLF